MSNIVKFLLVLAALRVTNKLTSATLVNGIVDLLTNIEDSSEESTENSTEVSDSDSSEDEDEDYIVTIENGQVRGIMNQTVDNNVTYYAFRGIPYAEPPLEDLRFTAPVAPSNWSDILNATTDKDKCVQGFSPVEGSEDCLYINVYTPTLNSSANLTVMVWIYGGGFIQGSSTYAHYGPDHLLEENVVFVSFNYRVGILGFLSTEDLTCPGNWGLKDQVLALKWVQSNIGYFGGNPNNVTIFGQSAGAASVSYLLQTNQTAGLFNAAILQSGQSLNLWALNTRAKRTAFAIGAALGYITTSSETLLKKLRSADYDTLQTVSYVVSTLITMENPLQGIMYGPVTELEHDGAILVNNSYDGLKQGIFHRVPLFIGTTSNEAAAIGDIPAILKSYLLNYDIATQHLAPYDLSTSFLTKLQVGSIVKNNYFGFLAITADEDNIVNFISQDQFNRPHDMAVRLTSQYTSVYYYIFSYEGTCSGVTNRNYTGIGHNEDTKYEFVSYNNCTDEDILTRQRYVRLLTNFAKYSNPTPTAEDLLQNITWPVVDYNSSGNLDYLNIDTNLTVDQNPFAEDMQFYDDLYDEFGEGNYTTY